jgi:hypothetical protein
MEVLSVCFFPTLLGIFESLTGSALYRDESKPLRFRDAQTSKSNIDIYSRSGKLINRLNVSSLLFSYVRQD